MISSPTKFMLLFAGSLGLAAAPGAFAGHPVGHSPYTVFKSMDADNDGQLTHAEHVAGSRQLFANMDTDRDGQVTLAELTAVYALKGDEPASADQPTADEVAAGIITLADTNKDGKLSAAEHAAADEALFVRLDTNQDGWLSQTECEAGRKTLVKGK